MNLYFKDQLPYTFDLIRFYVFQIIYEDKIKTKYSNKLEINNHFCDGIELFSLNDEEYRTHLKDEHLRITEIQRTSDDLSTLWEGVVKDKNALHFWSVMKRYSDDLTLYKIQASDSVHETASPSSPTLIRPSVSPNDMIFHRISNVNDVFEKYRKINENAETWTIGGVPIEIEETISNIIEIENLEKMSFDNPFLSFIIDLDRPCSFISKIFMERELKIAIEVEFEYFSDATHNYIKSLIKNEVNNDIICEDKDYIDKVYEHLQDIWRRQRYDHKSKGDGSINEATFLYDVMHRILHLTVEGEKLMKLDWQNKLAIEGNLNHANFDDYDLWFLKQTKSFQTTIKNARKLPDYNEN
ncbi:15348_t:CDS:2 [Entrophospora sp. SA101]|nr:15348_t:CDS:2 [Entrophospora sp. SA101]